MYLSSGLHGTSFAKDFREEKWSPLTHGLALSRVSKPWVRGSHFPHENPLQKLIPCNPELDYIISQISHVLYYDFKPT